MQVRQADLMVTEVRVMRATPPVEVVSSVYFGEQARFEAFVSNVGGATAPNVRVAFYMSDNEILNAATDIAVVDRGRLLAHAEPEELLSGVEGRVWEWVLPSAELPAARERWKISSTFRRADGVHARVVSAIAPAPEAVPVAPTLEDAYLSVLEGHRGERLEKVA
jgi:hypothetical protein